MKESQLAVYIMAHKAFEKPEVEGYVPLQVGAALNDDLGYVRDNDGENISAKNRNYCELTGLYWIWKNSPAEVVGLVHYRRYLSNMPMDTGLKHILTPADIEKRLKKSDIILPIPDVAAKTNQERYCEGHFEKDYILTKQTIQDIFPEYIPAFEKVMSSHKCCMCNMFIAPKKIADDYCQWLFAIFDELEKRVDLTDYSAYQARIYGFLSERLFNVWIEHNKLKKSYAFLANRDNDYLKILKDKIRGL